jgi:hypothetical protein
MILRKTNRKKLKDCLETKIVDGNIYTNLVIDGVKIEDRVLLSFISKDGGRVNMYLYKLNTTIRGVKYNYIKDYYIESIESTYTVDYDDYCIDSMIIVNLVKDKSE